MYSNLVQIPEYNEPLQGGEPELLKACEVIGVICKGDIVID